MAQGFSLHIGVNHVDQSHYADLVPPLNACMEDAQRMSHLAHQRGYDQSLILLNEEATRERVRDEITGIASAITPEDIFLLSFSGHGSQLPDTGDDPHDEEDGLDETWCLFDGQLLDDELRLLFSGFPRGARIIVLSDSCHSGTATHEWIHEFWGMIEGFTSGQNMRFRFLDDSRKKGIYRQNQDFYDTVREEIRNVPGHSVEASVCLISACQDNQRAVESSSLGAFTEALLIAMGENDQASYRQLHQEIFKHIRAIQSPHLFAYGNGVERLLDSRAFEI